MGVRKELTERGKSIHGESKGIIIRSIKKNGQRWRIIEVYVRQNLGEVLQGELESWIEEKETGLNTIMGGNFNARTGEMGGLRWS